MNEKCIKCGQSLKKEYYIFCDKCFKEEYQKYKHYNYPLLYSSKYKNYYIEVTTKDTVLFTPLITSKENYELLNKYFKDIDNPSLIITFMNNPKATSIMNILEFKIPINDDILTIYFKLKFQSSGGYVISKIKRHLLSN